MALSCPDVGPKPVFSDAINLILHERESISGGVCIGGPSEFGHLTLLHLRTSVLAIAIAILLTVPLGLYLGHIRKGEFVAVSVSNIGRAVPSLALLAFFVAFLGIGLLNVTVVFVLLAIPPILTNTYVGVRQVDAETVAAARGVGLTELQIMRQIELPMAAATIFTGIRTSAVAVVATLTISPLANVQSLGTPILEPQTYGDAGQVAAAIVVALITLAVDVGIGALARIATPKGLTVGNQVKARSPKRFSLGTPARTET